MGPTNCGLSTTMTIANARRFASTNDDSPSQSVSASLANLARDAPIHDLNPLLH